MGFNKNNHCKLQNKSHKVRNQKAYCLCDEIFNLKSIVKSNKIIFVETPNAFYEQFHALSM